MPTPEEKPQEEATPKTVNYLTQAQQEGDDWFEDALLRAAETHVKKLKAQAK